MTPIALLYPDVSLRVVERFRQYAERNSREAGAPVAIRVIPKALRVTVPPRISL